MRNNESRNAACGMALCALLGCAGTAWGGGAVGLTTTQPTGASAIVLFDTNSAQSASLPITVTGLQTGEHLLAIDFRPSNEMLYGLGSTGRLYTLNTTTGAATQVGSGAFAVVLNGAEFDLEFDALTDIARITSDLRQNMRVDPNTGVVIDGNPAF